MVKFSELRHSIRSYVSNRHFRQFALQNGCAAPHQARNKLPWGIDRLYRVLNLAKSGEDLLDDIFFQRFLDEGWTMQCTTLFGVQIIQTVDPQNVQAVLATKFKDFEVGERRHKQFGVVLGKSIFTSDGPFWEHSRALFRPQFAREQINDLASTEKSTQDLFQALGPVDENGWTASVDILPLLYHFTLDTATDFLFGQSVDSQLAALQTSKEDGDVAEKAGHVNAATDATHEDNFADAFATANEYMVLRIRLQGLYWLVNNTKLQRAVATMRRFTDQFVQLALQHSQSSKRAPSASEAADKERYSLLSALAAQAQDPTEIRDQLLAILLAGRDTTAALLGWVLYVLATHPALFQHLRAAVLAAFPPSSSSSTHPVTFTSLKACRYLTYVLNETLRLYPPVPLNSRVALRDTVLPTGGGPDGSRPIAVRKGQVVVFCVYAMQRREDLWGSDAGVFRPERWEGRKLDWGFLPFSGGPRVCLGQQYALTEAAYLVVRFLQRFDRIDPVSGADADAAADAAGSRAAPAAGKVEKGLGLIMSPRHGVRVRLHDAAAAAV
ncbi:hypothetical protein B0A49_13148 [Cryomyces minteri]|uniref:Cytochrome P450 52A13 n=1 Tax=Cryomyces minteri TaxID=331657 RepID=A0A4U0W5A2_9PEZI|nr:hypothetical protein B0A49_13148 [Cryomyces minteri]